MAFRVRPGCCTGSGVSPCSPICNAGTTPGSFTFILSGLVSVGGCACASLLNGASWNIPQNVPAGGNCWYQIDNILGTTCEYTTGSFSDVTIICEILLDGFTGNYCVEGFVQYTTGPTIMSGIVFDFAPGTGSYPCVTTIGGPISPTFILAANADACIDATSATATLTANV